MNAILNHPGSKWRMAEKIIGLMPPHRSYLEPFFGSGAVLFTKPPSAIETVNDLDGDIVNFFRILREEPERLARAVSLTPYARDVYDNAWNDFGEDMFDRAYRFAIRSKMAMGYKMHTKSGFKIDRYGRERSYAVGSWNEMPEDILQAATRLKGVQIENRPAVELIRKFAFDNVLIYSDPPYLMSTRGGRQYRFEMDTEDHIELLDALKRHPGPVIVSGYASELYDRELDGWARMTATAYNQKRRQAAGGVVVQF